MIPFGAPPDSIIAATLLSWGFFNSLSQLRKSAPSTMVSSDRQSLTPGSVEELAQPHGVVKLIRWNWARLIALLDGIERTVGLGSRARKDDFPMKPIWLLSGSHTSGCPRISGESRR